MQAVVPAGHRIPYAGPQVALQGGSVFKTMTPRQEIHLKVMRHLEEHPDVTQRELARHLGVSLGKINYCLKALIDRGWVKANNFKNSKHKAAYAYLLTPRGLEEKTQITLRFLKYKVQEYQQLKQEIAELEQEVLKQKPGGQVEEP